MEQIKIQISDLGESQEEQIKSALYNELQNITYSRYMTVTKNADGRIAVKAKSFLVAKIKLYGKQHYIELSPKYAKFMPDKLSKPYGDMVRVSIDTIDDVLELSQNIDMIYMSVLADQGGESFGCCAQYIQCSDALRCVNPDVLFAQACYYKKNLEAGRVFYGKNKNI